MALLHSVQATGVEVQNWGEHVNTGPGGSDDGTSETLRVNSVPPETTKFSGIMKLRLPVVDSRWLRSVVPAVTTVEEVEGTKVVAEVTRLRICSVP